MLPLTYGEYENKLCGSNLPLHIVVYYSTSLRRLDFNFLEHPGLF